MEKPNGFTGSGRLSAVLPLTLQDIDRRGTNAVAPALADIAGTIPPRKTRGANCTVAAIREMFAERPVDLALFESYLADPDVWPAPRLSELSYALGIEASDGPFKRHRQGGCRCRRP